MIGWIVLAIVIVAIISSFLIYFTHNILHRLYRLAKLIKEKPIQHLIRAYRFWKWSGFIFLFALGMIISFDDYLLALQSLTPLLIFCGMIIMEKLKHYATRKTFFEYRDLFFLPFLIYSSCLFVSILYRIMFTWGEHLSGPTMEQAFGLVKKVLTDWAFVDNLNLIFGYFVFSILWSACVTLTFRVEFRTQNLKDILFGMTKSLPYPLLLWALAFNKETVWVSKLVSKTGEYPIPHLTSNFMEFMLLTPFFFLAESKWTQFRPYMRKIGISLSVIPLLKLGWLFLPFLSNLGNIFALPANLLQVYFLVLGFSVGTLFSRPIGKKLESKKAHRVILLTLLILTILVPSQLPSSFVAIRVPGFEGSLYQFFHWDFEEFAILAIFFASLLTVTFCYSRCHYARRKKILVKATILLLFSIFVTWLYSCIKLIECIPAWKWWKYFVWQIGISIMILSTYISDIAIDTFPAES